MRRKRVGVWLGIVTVAVASCVQDPAGAPLETGVEEASDVSVLARSEAIAVVRDLTVLPNGDVWILNSVEPLFIGFGADGRLLGAHGALGGGPGEFGAPSAFVSGGLDDTAWVFDAERHALIEISEVNRARREIRLPTDESLPPTHLFGGRELIGAGVRTARVGDRVLFARNAPVMAGGLVSLWRAIWTADLVSLDPGTGAVEPVVSLEDVLGDPDQAFVLEGDFPPFPFWFRLWTVCGGSEVRVYDRLGNRVLAFASDGSPLGADTLPSVMPRRVTREQLARIGFGLGMLAAGGELTSRATPGDSARLIARLSRSVAVDPDDIASLLPRYVDLHCSGDGTLWLRRFDVDRGDLKGGRIWVRLPPEGPVGEVALPESFDAYRFLPDRVWGVQRDSLDVGVIASVALPPL